MSRTSDRQGLDDQTWKRMAERDLDEVFTALKADRDYLENKFREAREWTTTAIAVALAPVQSELAELRRENTDLKETSKWQLRTLVGLLVSVVLLLGGVVTTLVVR
jgi:hypothetical protein